MKATTPSRWVQMLPVSVWILAANHSSVFTLTAANHGAVLPEDGGEALLEAGQRRPVALLQEVVILQQHEVTIYCSHYWHW